MVCPDPSRSSRWRRRPSRSPRHTPRARHRHAQRRAATPWSSSRAAADNQASMVARLRPVVLTPSQSVATTCRRAPGGPALVAPARQGLVQVGGLDGHHVDDLVQVAIRGGLGAGLHAWSGTWAPSACRTAGTPTTSPLASPIPILLRRLQRGRAGRAALSARRVKADRVGHHEGREPALKPQQVSLR